MGKGKLKVVLAAALAFAAVSVYGQNCCSEGCAENGAKIAIAAHRGFWDCDGAGRMENTIAALREAQTAGLWGSEFDVHLTADDQIVVHHDRHIQGVDIQTSELGQLRGFTLKNGEKLPTLDEYLEQGSKSAGTVLVLEFKAQYDEARENALVDLALQKIKEHNLYDPSRIMFISFSLNICRRVAQKAPEFTNQYLSGDIAPSELKAMGINGIDYHHDVLGKHPEWVGEAHGLDMSVNAWTVNGAADIKKMIALGVDCITTNDPLLVRELLGERELRLSDR